MTGRFAPLLVFAAAFAVYANTLWGGFVYDDTFQVLSNPWIESARHLDEIFLSDVWEFGEGQVSGETSYYRPLMYVIYMICHALFGLQPWGFHLVNVLLHAGTTVLVYRVASRVLPEGGIPSVVALIFAVHPLHSEAVAWVGAVPELSFSFFFLLSFELYAGRRGALRYGCSLVAFALALLSKEPALALPVVLVAYDFLLAGEHPSPAPLDLLRRYGPLALVALGYLVLRTVALGGVLPVSGETGLDLTPAQALLNVFPLLLLYVRWMLLPLDLSALHRFHVESAADPWAIAGLLAIPAVALLVWLSFRRNRVGLLGLALLILPLIPVLYVPALQANTMAERYAYLPSFGLMLMLASVAERGLRARPRLRTPAALCCAALLVLMSIGTWQRNRVWRTDAALWADTLKRPVDAARHVVWGNHLLSQGNVEAAIEQYRFAVEVEPDSADTHVKLGLAYARAANDPESAIRELETAAKLRPHAPTHFNLGYLYRQTGHPRQAIDHFERALTLDPALDPARQALEALRGKEDP